MEPSSASRLFGTIIVMGCALGASGCLETVPENACPPVCPDMGAPDAHGDGTDHDGGWPPTK